MPLIKDILLNVYMYMKLHNKSYNKSFYKNKKYYNIYCTINCIMMNFNFWFKQSLNVACYKLIYAKIVI